MGESIRLRLEDGQELEAILDDPDDGLRARLATASAPLALLAADDDVEGHGMSPIVRARVEDAGDTAGHALTLRLPDAEAAREVQRRRLGAGLVGVVVVGGGSTSMWVPDAGASIAGGTLDPDGSRERGGTDRRAGTDAGRG